VWGYHTTSVRRASGTGWLAGQPRRPEWATCARWPGLSRRVPSQQSGNVTRRVSGRPGGQAGMSAETAGPRPHPQATTPRSGGRVANGSPASIASPTG